MDKYSANALPATVMAGVRMATMIAGPYLVSSGVIEADSVEGVFTAVAVVGVTLYGLWRTHQRQRKINTAETVLGPIHTKKG